MSRLFLPISLLLATAGWWLFNAAALASLHQRWWTWGETYEIGYPLLAIAFYWVFMQRSHLRIVAINPSWLGGLLLLGTLLLSSAARLVQLQVIQQLMVPVSLWCGLFALFGWRCAAQLLLPCGLLLAGVPIWDFLVDPLRMLTVWAVQGLLSLLTIPALVQGYRIVLPGGVMLIEDACSGLNLLLAALVLSVLHAELNLYSFGRKLWVVALGIVIGVVDNWLRVFGLVAIAYFSDMKSSLVHDHISFGWWLFVASLVPFFFIARVIERGDTLTAEQRSSITAPAVHYSFAGRKIANAALLIALVTSGFFALLYRTENANDQVPIGFATPVGAQVSSSGWLPQYAGYDLAQTWKFTEGDRVFDLAALTYVDQQRDRKLIYYTNRIADKDSIVASSVVALSSGQYVNISIIQDRGWRIVWWYYWVDGITTTTAWQVKVLQLRAAFFGDASAALVTLSAPCLQARCESELHGSLSKAVQGAMSLNSIQRQAVDAVWSTKK